MTPAQDIVWRMWPLMIVALVWITSVKMCLRQKTTDHAQMVTRQIQAALLGVLLSLLLLSFLLLIASIIDGACE